MGRVILGGRGEEGSGECELVALPFHGARWEKGGL